MVPQSPILIRTFVALSLIVGGCAQTEASSAQSFLCEQGACPGAGPSESLRAALASSRQAGRMAWNHPEVVELVSGIGTAYAGRAAELEITAFFFGLGRGYIANDAPSRDIARAVFTEAAAEQLDLVALAEALTGNEAPLPAGISVSPTLRSVLSTPNAPVWTNPEFRILFRQLVRAFDGKASELAIPVRTTGVLPEQLNWGLTPTVLMRGAIEETIRAFESPRTAQFVDACIAQLEHPEPATPMVPSACAIDLTPELRAALSLPNPWPNAGVQDVRRELSACYALAPTALVGAAQTAGMTRLGQIDWSGPARDVAFALMSSASGEQKLPEVVEAAAAHNTQQTPPAPLTDSEKAQLTSGDVAWEHPAFRDAVSSLADIYATRANDLLVAARAAGMDVGAVYWEQSSSLILFQIVSNSRGNPDQFTAFVSSLDGF